MHLNTIAPQFRILASAAVFLITAGCISKPLQHSSMTPTLVLGYTSPFSGRMQIGSIDTGDTMNYVTNQENYQDAVYFSLKNHGLLRDEAIKNPVELFVVARSFSETKSDSKVTVDAVVHYRLMDLKQRTNVIDQTIRTSGDYYIGGEKPGDRVLMVNDYFRRAKQEAIRKNMAELLRLLRKEG